MGSVGRAPSQCKSVSVKGAVDDADEEDEEDDSGERAPPTWQRSAAAAAPASSTRLRARDPSVAATRGAASAAGAAVKGEDDDFKDDRASTSFGKASKLQLRQAGSRCGPFMRHRDDAREPPKMMQKQPLREVQRSAAPASSASPRELERAPRGLPRWCTFEQSIDVWVDELNTFQIDATAQKELFLLAQLSERGYQESNAIVGKLLKKQADGVFIGNASGFVHACVNNARAKISREDGTSWR